MSSLPGGCWRLGQSPGIRQSPLDASVLLRGSHLCPLFQLELPTPFPVTAHPPSAVLSMAWGSGVRMSDFWQTGECQTGG